jgi:hypothetical protein
VEARFAKEGTPVKVDLILGYPGETTKSWFVGIGDLFRDGFHEDVHIHYLSLLPNTPLYDQIEQHGLHVVRKPFRLLIEHSEASEVVVGTNTMPPAEWVECGALSAPYRHPHTGEGDQVSGDVPATGTRACPTRPFTRVS